MFSDTVARLMRRLGGYFRVPGAIGTDAIGVVPDTRPILDWRDVIPPILGAYRLELPAGSDRQAEWELAVAQLRFLLGDGMYRVVEEFPSEDRGDGMTILYDFGLWPADSVKDAFDRLYFGHWYLTDLDSELGFLHLDSKVYLKVAVGYQEVEVVLPVGLESGENAASALSSIGAMEAVNPKSIEWGYLSHYVQEVMFGGSIEEFEKFVVKKGRDGLPSVK